MTEVVGASAFDGPRLLRPGVVVVAFLADWCPHCDRFLPEVERLAGEGLTVLRADVSDEESPLWDRFRVEIVPTLLVFRHGSEIFRADGTPGVGLRRAEVDGVANVARVAARGAA